MGAVRGTSLLIEYMDCGPSADLLLHDIKERSWQSLEVSDQRFFRQQPVCGLNVTEKTIIFGGSGVNQFQFTQSDVDTRQGQLNLKVARGNFKDRTGFCGGCDSVIKMYSNKIYAVDATNLALHTFD